MIFSHGVKLAGTASLLALSALGAAAPALAQDAADAVSAPTGLNDIVVTAQKREQRLQDVPVSIVAIGGRQIEDMKITDRKSVGEGKRVSVRVDLGGRRIIKKNK